MTIPAERLTALEIRDAERERTIEDLSQQVAAQWAVIDRLQTRLDGLAERFLSFEDRAAADVPATRPPHW